MRSVSTPQVSTKELQAGLPPALLPSLAARKVVEAIDAGLIADPPPEVAQVLASHRAALRSLRAHRQEVPDRFPTALRTVQQRLREQLDVGQDLDHDDVEALRQARLEDLAEESVTAALEGFVEGTGSAVTLEVSGSVDEMIATAVAPLLEALNRDWQPLLEALEDRDPRRSELFVELDDVAGREAMHGAREVAARLRKVRQLHRDLVVVRVDNWQFGEWERAGLFDRPVGGPVEGSDLDRLVLAGVRPDWCPSVAELADAGRPPLRSIVDDPREARRREAEYARREVEARKTHAMPATTSALQPPVVAS
ncbi:hypothetical protein [Kineococcus rubinsiae]|uniref:hypothetical protein n=1 Tax=Kineococcus rubinsiae TaxID=2609562 RepID=UPI001430B6F5|nr:hypothetical protein [Kineococcus rubinsiae]NIZ91567.1 hypothetical protein [Kineococcus rubinsiae]